MGWLIDIAGHPPARPRLHRGKGYKQKIWVNPFLAAKEMVPGRPQRDCEKTMLKCAEFGHSMPWFSATGVSMRRKRRKKPVER